MRHPPPSCAGKVKKLSIRCFVAVELEEGITRKLGKIIEEIRHKLGTDNKSIRWVNPENIHLTLKFLGEVDDNLICDICQATDRCAGEFEPFEFTVAGLGCFPPGGGAARVLWVGLEEGRENLQALQEGLEDALKELDFPPEPRKFSPHLTLARIKNAAVGKAGQQLIKTINPPVLGSQYVSELVVFQSELTKTGPIYTPLHHAPLGK